MKNFLILKLLTVIFSGIFFVVVSNTKVVGGIISTNWTSNGVPVVVAANNQWAFQAIPDGNGGLFVVWQDERNGFANRDIYAQRFDSNGNALWTANGVVVCDAADNQLLPSLISDRAGGIIVSWDDERLGNPNSDIYAQRLDDNGNILWAANGIVVNAEVDRQGLTRMIPDSNFGAIIVWNDARSGVVGESDLYAQRINSAGSRLWAASGVQISSMAGAEYNQVIISDDNGGAIIAWPDESGSSVDEDIYIQRVDATGNLLWAAGGVPVVTAQFSQVFNSDSIVSDGANGAIVVWEDYRAGPLMFDELDIYAQHINSSGNALWANDGIPIANVNGYQENPEIISDAQGGYLITWDDWRPSNLNSDIYVQRLNSSGTALWQDNGILITNAVNDQFTPQISLDLNNNYILIWEDYRNDDGSFTNPDIYSQRINLNGELLYAQDQVISNYTGKQTFIVKLLTDNNDDFTAIWEDNRDEGGNTYNIYMQNFSSANQIKLTGSQDIIDSTSGQSYKFGSQFGSTNTAQSFRLKDTSANILVAETIVNLSNERNWSAVAAAANLATGEAVVSGLSGATGASATHSLYVPIPAGKNSNRVFICPSATDLNAVSQDCSGAEIRYPTSANTSQENIGGINYWKIDALTSTGGSASITNSLSLTLSSNNITTGQTFSLTVSARDSNGSVDPNYRGTITFTSSGASVTLPANFTFTSTDYGIKTFSNAAAFTTVGTYTITVTDINESSLSVTSPPIIVSQSATPTAAVSQTPTPQDCVTNPVQIQCQAEVIIYNIRHTPNLLNKSFQICWDTNIETLGYLKYGKSQDGIYNKISDFEADYAIFNHCLDLKQLELTANYIYKIVAVSPAGKQATANGVFTLGGQTILAPSPGTTDKDCISLSVNYYSFTSLQQAILNYQTEGSASCLVRYSNDNNDLKYASAKTALGIQHKSTLDLNNLDGTSHLYFKISCNLVNKQCETGGLIPVSRYLPFYLPKTVTPQVTGANLGSSAAISALALITCSAGVCTIAYPRWIQYAFLLLKRKKKAAPWGIVYDIKTRKIIPFAIIRIYNITEPKKVVRQAVSDLEGRYGFTLDKGQYKVTVEQDGYHPLEFSVAATNEDFYFTKDIGLATLEDQKSKMLQQISTLKETLRKNLFKITTLFFIVGFIFAVYAVIFSLTIYNVVVLALFIIQAVLLVIIPRKISFGYIFDENSKERIAGAFVRLFDIKQGRQVDIIMTDEKGRYGFLLDPGDYFLKVDKQGYDYGTGIRDRLFINTLKEKFIKLTLTKDTPLNLMVPMVKSMPV